MIRARTRASLILTALLATGAPWADVGHAQSRTAEGSRGPTVNAVSIREARLVPGGRPVVVTLMGSGLAELTGALVASRGRPVPDTRADLAPMRSRTRRDVEILAGPDAPSGTWELVLSYRDGRRRTRSIVAPVRVAVGSTGRIGPTRAAPARFEPVPVTTDVLRVTGRRFAPVALTTERLRITGRRFVPVALATEPLRITGRRFVPVHVQTDVLRITGRREENP